MNSDLTLNKDVTDALPLFKATVACLITIFSLSSRLGESPKTGN